MDSRLFVMCLYLTQFACNEVPLLSNGTDTEEPNDTLVGSQGTNSSCPDESGCAEIESIIVSTTENLITGETGISLTNETTDFPASSTTTVSPSQQNTTTIPNTTEVTLTTAVMNLSAVNTTTIPAKQPKHKPTRTSGICACDLTMNLCDINCCCDSDCNLEDRSVFVRCQLTEQYFPDPRYCYQTRFTLHNNTELTTIQSRDGLFCVLRNNLPATVQYQNRDGVDTLKEFNKLYDRQKPHSWPVHTAREQTYQMEKYVTGSPIWVIKKDSLIPLSVPVRGVNTFCQTSKDVEYLHDSSSSCSQMIPTTDCEAIEHFDAATFYKNITVITSPDLINQTEQNLILEQCVNTTCVPVLSILCSSGVETTDVDKCSPSTEIQSPVFMKELNVCLNVVQRVRYVIHHNGSRGINKVLAYFSLANISSSTLQMQFSQHFSVEFKWVKENDTFKRSGRPGYLAGKPILAGRKVIHKSKEENGVVKSGIELSRNPVHWLGIPAVRRDGTCDWVSKQPVTFADNRRSTCSSSLNVSNFTSTTTCAVLQRKILVLLAGDAISNITEAKQFNRFVATFGDSRVEDAGDWVQVLVVNFPNTVTSSSSTRDGESSVCKSIITSIHLNVVFAHVGALANPQAKILGVTLGFGEPHDLVFRCSPRKCSSLNSTDRERTSFQVSSTVSFVDVTQPAKTYFSEPPVYEVKLAYDFFYPFFSSSDIPTASMWILIGVLVIQCVLGTVF